MTSQNIYMLWKRLILSVEHQNRQVTCVLRGFLSFLLSGLHFFYSNSKNSIVWWVCSMDLGHCYTLSNEHSTPEILYNCSDRLSSTSSDEFTYDISWNFTTSISHRVSLQKVYPGLLAQRVTLSSPSSSSRSAKAASKSSNWRMRRSTHSSISSWTHTHTGVKCYRSKHINIYSTTACELIAMIWLQQSSK